MACGKFRGPRFDQNGVGESAWLEKVFAEHLAHGFIAATAQMACPTGNVVRNGHPVALGKSGDTAAKRNNLTHQLMAKHGAGFGGAGVQLEQVGAAKPHHPQAQQKLPGARHWCRSFFQNRPLATETGDHHMISLPALMGRTRLHNRSHVIRHPQ